MERGHMHVDQHYSLPMLTIETYPNATCSSSYMSVARVHGRCHGPLSYACGPPQQPTNIDHCCILKGRLILPPICRLLGPKTVAIGQDEEHMDHHGSLPMLTIAVYSKTSYISICMPVAKGSEPLLGTRGMCIRTFMVACRCWPLLHIQMRPALTSTCRLLGPEAVALGQGQEYMDHHGSLPVLTFAVCSNAIYISFYMSVARGSEPLLWPRSCACRPLQQLTNVDHCCTFKCNLNSLLNVGC